MIPLANLCVRRAAPGYASCPTTEPTLDQLLADPLIGLMMRSDGVVEADIRALARPRLVPWRA